MLLQQCSRDRIHQSSSAEKWENIAAQFTSSQFRLLFVPSVDAPAPRLPGYIRNDDRHKLMFRIYYDILFKINISCSCVCCCRVGGRSEFTTFVRMKAYLWVDLIVARVRVSERHARVRSHIVDTVITHMARRTSLKGKLARDRIYSYLSLYHFTASPPSPHEIVLRRRRVVVSNCPKRERKSDAN